MKRNDIATVDQLVPGDRFYKVKDKGKDVLEWDKFAPGGKTVIAWTINNRNERQKPVNVSLITEVVYLRNITDKFAEAIKKATNE